MYLTILFFIPSHFELCSITRYYSAFKTFHLVKNHTLYIEKVRFWISSKVGGLYRDSRSRHQKKVSLNGQENLDSFKKLISTIEISRSRCRNLNFARHDRKVRKVSIETEKSVETWHFCKPGGLDLSRRGLDRDSRSRCQKSISLDVMDNLDGFQKLVSTRRTISISIGLDCRDPQG